MWNDGALKMYMDADIQERLAEAQRGYAVRKSIQLDRLWARLRRAQAEVEAVDVAVPAKRMPAYPRT